MSRPRSRTNHSNEPSRVAGARRSGARDLAQLGSGDGTRGGDGVLLAAISGRGRPGRSAHVVVGCAAGARRSGPDRRANARSCSVPTRSRPASTRPRRTRHPRDVAGRSRSRSTSTRAWRSGYYEIVMEIDVGEKVRRDYAFFVVRPSGVRASWSRWPPIRGTPTTTSADRTSTPVARTFRCSGRWRRAISTSRRGKVGV